MPEPRPRPAEMYQRFFVPGIFERWTPLLLERAEPRPGERVLDLACGTGVVARHVAPRVGEEGAVVAVDPDPDMLAVARTLPEPTGAAIEWLEREATDLPDGPFDLALCQQGLQFIEDRAAALEETGRVLARGGRIGLSVWRGLEHQPVYAALCEAEAEHLQTPVEVVAGPPFSLGNADAVRGLLEGAGFERVEIEPVEHDVRFPEPTRFVTLTTLASAAVIPEHAEMDESTREELVVAMNREMEPVLEEYVEDGEVVFPMRGNVATARRP